MDPTGRETAAWAQWLQSAVSPFDGNGNSSSVQNISRNGTYTFDVESAGTYEVAEDCTGKFIDTMGNEVSRIVIVDDGKEFYGLSLTAGAAIYGVWKKIHNDRDR